MANRWGGNGNSERLYFLGPKITANGDCSHEFKRCLLLGRKAMTNLDSILKSRDVTLPTKIHLVKDMVFPLVMYGCKSWTIKKNKTKCKKLMLLNRGVGEDSWESLGLQGDQVHPKGNQSWIFIGRTDAEAEAPILWPPDVKNWLTGKGPDAGKDWGQEKRRTEDKMVGWHHRLNGHEQTPGGSGGQRRLACRSPRGRKESDNT